MDPGLRPPVSRIKLWWRDEGEPLLVHGLLVKDVQGEGIRIGEAVTEGYAPHVA
jgi:hypothetical protein